jgi:hypothetical protein
MVEGRHVQQKGKSNDKRERTMAKGRREKAMEENKNLKKQW